MSFEDAKAALKNAVLKVGSMWCCGGIGDADVAFAESALYDAAIEFAKAYKEKYACDNCFGSGCDCGDQCPHCVCSACNGTGVNKP